MRGILGSLERHSKRYKYGTSFVTGQEFSNAREALMSKQKDLKKQGRGNKPKTADAINENEINELYNQQQLGNATPASLLNTMWLNNTLHFGIWAGDQHRSLYFGDLKLCYDQDMKAEYLLFNERQTKLERAKKLETHEQVLLGCMRRVTADVRSKCTKHTNRNDRRIFARTTIHLTLYL